MTNEKYIAGCFFTTNLAHRREKKHAQYLLLINEKESAYKKIIQYFTTKHD